MTPGIGAFMVDIEIMMSVLDGGDTISTCGKACDQTFGHRRLAGIFPAGDAEQLLVHSITSASFCAATRSSGRLMLKNGSYVSGLLPMKASGKSTVSNPICPPKAKTLALLVLASQAASSSANPVSHRPKIGWIRLKGTRREQRALRFHSDAKEGGRRGHGEGMAYLRLSSATARPLVPASVRSEYRPEGRHVLQASP